MPQPHNTLTPYYAKNGIVWKHPLATPYDGGQKISLGFPICKMHEAVGNAAAESVAALMKSGHQASSKPPGVKSKE